MIDRIFKYSAPGFIRSIVGLITLEQLAVAGATALLAVAAKRISSPDEVTLFLVAFFIVSQAPNIIFMFIRRTEMRGYLEMYYGFLEERLFRRHGRPASWANKGMRERYLTAIGPEGETYVSALAYSYLDIYSYCLNIVLNAIALALVIDGDFLWVFGVSAGLSFLMWKYRSSALDQIVEQEQKSKLDFLAHILKAWDNVLLRNSFVFTSYKEHSDRRFQEARDLAGRSAFQGGFNVFLLTLVSSFPIFALNVYLALSQRAEPELIAALLVTLPRQMQVLSTFRSFFQQITNVKIFSKRLESALNNSEIEDLDLQNLIRIGEIRIDDQPVRDIDNIVETLSNRRNGRILISGLNGSGKTSLLLVLHSQLKDSIYLPATPAFLIGDESPNGSTGQMILAHLEFLSRQRSPVFLLDEWDANLDSENRSAVSARLDELSLTRLVVEVRHNV